MLKLYKLDDRPPRYWETWENQDGSHTVHWGVLGETGQSRSIDSSAPDSATKRIRAEVDGTMARGYRPVDLDDHSILLIEYAVDGFGTDEDLDKRHKLQARMDDTLGWTGLGHCDGGSSGSGTMEACCFVVDFELARSVIEADLKGTEFADYTRIYDERART